MSRKKKTTDEKVQAYYKELSLEGDFDIDFLIESHRRLREDYRELLKGENEAWSSSRKAGYEYGVSEAKDTHLSFAQLRAMPLGELADLIATKGHH